jgi:hypothetical protein
MRFLWFYIICWKHRNDKFYELAETYALVLKAARRCNYDLGHAIGQMKGADTKTREMFYNGYNMWKKIFSPDGGKNYRHELHQAIAELEMHIRRLNKQIQGAGLVPVGSDDVPF